VALRFLDTNILLRHLSQDHPDHSPRATALLKQGENGELRVRLHDLVIAETVFTFQRTYKVPKAHIASALLPLIDLPGVELRGKRNYTRIFDLYVRLNISYADAYLAFVMRQAGSSQIHSSDRDFDRVPAISRVEP
jgi:uncharacterized protein